MGGREHDDVVGVVGMVHVRRVDVLLRLAEDIHAGLEIGEAVLGGVAFDSGGEQFQVVVDDTCKVAEILLHAVQDCTELNRAHSLFVLFIC